MSRMPKRKNSRTTAIVLLVIGALLCVIAVILDGTVPGWNHAWFVVMLAVAICLILLGGQRLTRHDK